MQPEGKQNILKSLGHNASFVLDPTDLTSSCLQTASRCTWGISDDEEEVTVLPQSSGKDKVLSILVRECPKAAGAQEKPSSQRRVREVSEEMALELAL